MIFHFPTDLDPAGNRSSSKNGVDGSGAAGELDSFAGYRLVLDDTIEPNRVRATRNCCGHDPSFLSW